MLYYVFVYGILYIHQRERMSHTFVCMWLLQVEYTPYETGSDYHVNMDENIHTTQSHCAQCVIEEGKTMKQSSAERLFRRESS